MNESERRRLHLFLRTIRSRMLPKPMPPLSDEEQEERKDAQAKLRADLDQMKAKHTNAPAEE